MTLKLALQQLSVREEMRLVNLELQKIVSIIVVRIKCYKWERTEQRCPAYLAGINTFHDGKTSLFG